MYWKTACYNTAANNMLRICKRTAHISWRVYMLLYNLATIIIHVAQWRSKNESFVMTFAGSFMV